MDINALLLQGENQALEFKEWGVRPEQIAKEVVAFAYAAGGTVLVGVTDEGRPVGVPYDVHFEEWVANIIRNNVQPPLECDAHCEIHQELRIDIVTVPKGRDKPYQTNKNQFLVRVGSTNRVASIQELLRLFQQSGVFHYDAVAVTGSKYSDLNAAALEKYFAQYDVDYSDEEEKSNLLNNVDIMTGAELTVGGLLVFGIYPQKHLPNACISYAHYLGDNPGEELLDKRVIDGALPDQIDNALIAIKHNIKQPSTIKGAKREAVNSDYPDRVFRELIVNAVTLRNYGISGSRIRILQFSDRIEFISPGRLPNTVSV